VESLVVLLGVDLGTRGCKLTLVDTLGSIIGSSFTEYKTFNYPHGVGDMWYIMAATNSCASANRWTRDTLGRWEVDASALTGKSAFQLMDEEAAKAPVGSAGPFFSIPTCSGSAARTSIPTCAQALSGRP